MKKVFVIAGASRGLGKQVARQAHVSGYPVALLARGAVDLDAAGAEIRLAGGGARLTTHAVDLTSPSATEEAFEQITEQHGPIAVLVNCTAAWFSGKDARQLTLDDFQNAMALNFFTAFNTTRACLLHRSDPGAELAIINVGATASTRGSIRMSPFSAAKAALRNFSHSMARELAPEGVHIAHLVIDGLIDNPRTRSVHQTMPDEHFISPSSIAKTIIQVAEQDKSCWTFEWDIRPYCEKW